MGCTIAMVTDLDPAAAVDQAEENGPDGRLELVVQLVEAFLDGLGSEPGFRESRVAEAEHRLGVTFPGAFRTGYLRFGRLAQLSAQDHFVEPDRLEMVGDELVFRVENQGCAWWSCSVCDGDDPGVKLWLDDHQYMADAGTVSQFFVHAALSEIVLGARYTADVELETAIDMPFQFGRRLDVAPFLWWPGPNLPARQFFGAEGLIMAADPTPWLWGAATTRQALGRLTAVDAGPWRTH